MKRILTAIAALAVVAGSALPSFAGMLDDIRSRGVVRIGANRQMKLGGSMFVIERGNAVPLHQGDHALNVFAVHRLTPSFRSSSTACPR